MPYFDKTNGLTREIIRNPKLATKKAHLPGKYYAFNDSIDGYSGFEIETVAATPTEKEFLEGNADRTALVLPNDITDVAANIGTLFPNLSVIIAQNTSQVVSGLPDIEATAIVPNTLESSYEADATYSGYSDLTFDSWSLSTSTTIPYIGNSELTLAYVKLFVDNAGGNASVVDKVIIAPEFTTFEAGVFDYIFLKFVNCQEVEYGALKVPAEYQEIEYIESSGTQWIKTIVTTTTTQSIELLFASSVAIPSGETFIFGVWSTGLGDSARAGFANGNLYNQGQFSYQFDGTLGVGTLIKATSNDLSAVTAGLQYALFGCNVPSNNTIVGKISAKLYSCKIFDGNTLVCNFVPCYRKSDGEIGLYDTVNNVFYTNQGTGAFLKGDDMPNGIIERPLLSTATIYYDSNTSHTLTPEIVQATLTKVPEFASCEKVIVPVWFTEYQSGSISAIESSFSDMEVLTTCYEDGNIDIEIGGPIEQSVIAQNKTLDSELSYARTLSRATNRGGGGFLGIWNSIFDSSAIIYPPIKYNGYWYNSGVSPNLSPNLLYADFEVNDVAYAGVGVGFNKSTLVYLRFTCTGSSVGNINLDNTANLKTLLLPGFVNSVDIRRSNALDRSALVALFNSLGTPATTKTLTIGATNLAKLTAEDIAIATAKNWSVVA